MSDNHNEGDFKKLELDPENYDKIKTCFRQINANFHPNENGCVNLILKVPGPIAPHTKLKGLSKVKNNRAKFADSSWNFELFHHSK